MLAEFLLRLAVKTVTLGRFLASSCKEKRRMPFVKRDADGKITAVHMEAQEDGFEEVGADDPEVSDFLYQ